MQAPVGSVNKTLDMYSRKPEVDPEMVMFSTPSSVREERDRDESIAYMEGWGDQIDFGEAWSTDAQP